MSDLSKLTDAELCERLRNIGAPEIVYEAASRLDALTRWNPGQPNDRRWVQVYHTSSRQVREAWWCETDNCWETAFGGVRPEYVGGWREMTEWREPGGFPHINRTRVRSAG